MIMDFSNRLADNLRKRRGNVSQARFARKLGISRPTLTRLENAQQNTTIATLERVCKALKCDIGDIFKAM